MHFVTLIIGPDPERQLEPFNENLGGAGLEFQDQTEHLNFVLSQLSVSERAGSTLDSLAQTFGFEQRNGVWGYWSNPNAKWDWYQLGGRWSGEYLHHRDGYAVDQALKRDVDWDTPRRYREGRVRAEYASWRALADDALNRPVDEWCEEAWKSNEPLRLWGSHEPRRPRDVYESVQEMSDKEFVFREANWAGLVDSERWDVLTLQEATARCAYPPFYALLDHGQWLDEREDRDEPWPSVVQRHIEAASREDLLSVYDLHT